MTILSTFDSTKESLSEILATIRTGKTQLPDFQRGWVWDDEHIRSLLASISKSFPVGAIMMLQTGNPNVRFLPRLVEGVVNPTGEAKEAERLILDGQQRLTSTYQALFSGKVVETKDARKKRLTRWYYIDIREALDQSVDREDAIHSIPEDRMVRNFRGEVIKDYSTIEKECDAEFFPLPLVYDQAGMTTWQLKYIQSDPEKMVERLGRWNEFVQSVVMAFQQYQVPLILLRKETPKEAVCQVFEKVNTGGVHLTVFELLTATFASDNFNLRDDWKVQEARLKAHRVLSTVTSDDVLQAVTLLATYEKRQGELEKGTPAENASGVSCKRKEVLELSLESYKRWARLVVDGYEQAAKFLHGLGLYAACDLPYRTQLVPLAAALAMLGDLAETDGARKKLARWYWSGVFGELYGSATEWRFAKDVVELVAWVRGGAEPSTTSDGNFSSARLLTLRTRNSAAYKGINALLLLQGGLDFRTGSTIDTQIYFDEQIDIHHIFPQAWCTEQKLDRGRFDCIINKTPISGKTNRIIGRKAPSAYLVRLQKEADIAADRMDEILRSHLIEPEQARSDDFEAFFAARASALLDQIERAMGKKVQRDQFDVEEYGDDEAVSAEENFL
jgi:hypothetical protein